MTNGPITYWIPEAAGSEVTLTAAAAVDVGVETSPRIFITGAGASIASLGAQPNRLRFLRFDGVNTIVHNGTTLNCPGGLDIVTANQYGLLATSDVSGNYTVYDLSGRGPIGASAIDVYSSSYSSLTVGNTVAAAVGGTLVIDRNWTLTANQSFTVPVRFSSGNITRGAYTITFGRPCYINEFQKAFDRTGTGLVTFNKNTAISVWWFGTTGQGGAGSSNDDTVAIQQAINSMAASVAFLDNVGSNTSGGSVLIRNGTFKVTSTLTWTQSYCAFIGGGSLATTILFEPTAADTCLLIAQTGTQVNGFAMSGIAFYSKDATWAKIAIDATDISYSSFYDVTIWGTGTAVGPGAGNLWSDATGGSYGVVFRGRDQFSWIKSRIWADKCVRISANPNDTRSNCEDCDHFDFDDYYWICGVLGDFFVADDGIGVTNLSFSPYGAFVGDGRIKINDTRVAPAVTSECISISASRFEQASTASRFLIDVAFTTPCRSMEIEKTLLGAGSKSLSINGVLHLKISATITGNVAITAPVNTEATLQFENCEIDSSITAVLSGYLLTQATAWKSALPLPSSATYTYDGNSGQGGQSFLYNPVISNGVRTLMWRTVLDPGNSVNLSVDFVGQGLTSLHVSVRGIGQYGEVEYVGTTLTKISGSANFAVTNSATNLCLYKDGSNNLILLNNTAGSLINATIATATI